ncbi:MAG: prepilin-type N-terminal cleavage/methylation domain-containing protein [Candidatus Nomurabacteria bacterium]|nr:prepilin-type N-terminal cleavage/methylation domain-containing protein [Candidatus Saccharibacteria bacterium]USN95227.1 MAG: prepilin-type N-terminal cleavage/methylation domain-containing protein [Candidatus Nomurabacteria bacterium]
MIRANLHGFTLPELLVTIVVIGIVFMGLSSIFISIQRIQVKTAYLESATRSAQKEIESLRNINYNNLTAGQNIDFSDQLVDLPTGSTGSVAVTEPSPGLKRVDVTVTYSYEGQTKNVNLSSLIGVIGIAQ